MRLIFNIRKTYMKIIYTLLFFIFLLFILCILCITNKQYVNNNYQYNLKKDGCVIIKDAIEAFKIFISILKS